MPAMDDLHEMVVVNPGPVPPQSAWSSGPVIGGETISSLRRQRLSTAGRQTVVDEAIEVLCRCVPPSQHNGSDTGLVIGYVQSGKTMSFTTVSALAHDNGFPLVIVITGISTSLLGQSTDRLKKDLGVESGSGRWKHFSSEELHGNRLSSVLTRTSLIT